MDNQEKLAAYNTQAEDKQNNNKTQCVLGTTIRKITTTNVNKIRALLPPTTCKDVPNTVCGIAKDFTTRNYHT